MASSTQPTTTNSLIHETSPYLLQHAHNPVDWYAWGAEALQRARREDKPILLSIGYSACHWCHVMAHESFEDPETAAMMNDWFVNIKVDREERLDLDAIYMEAVQAMTGQGGWPMTVFLTPSGEPFYGGTYYPPEPRHGMPAFRQVLAAVANAWRERRGDLEQAGGRLKESLKHAESWGDSGTAPGQETLERAVQNLLLRLDRAEGGFGGAPKFPQPMVLDFLLQVYQRMRAEDVLSAVTLTLTKMAHGGIYDHLGGGFHRYSTDAHWLVPHFEKMLYDNAQLARTYLHAWQVTADPAYRRVVEGTLDYLLREMAAPEGGFYSSEDADSEGQEGKYYLWTLREVRALLGEENAGRFADHYGLAAAGNFREGGPGANILHVTHAAEATGQAPDEEPGHLERTLQHGREILYAARSQRVHPGQDRKILAEWNGLTLHALAEAGAALGRPDYLEAARGLGDFILNRMARTVQDGSLRLYRSYKDGQARLDGYLEDYAAVALGLLALYEATLELPWLQAAADLAAQLPVLFGDPERGGFYQTSIEHETLLVRRKDVIDNAIPAGNSLAAELYLRLGRLLEDESYAGYARGIMRTVAAALGEQPLAFGRLLQAVDLDLDPGWEIAVVGAPEAPDTQALLAELWRLFLPTSVWALRPVADEDEAPDLMPFLADRGQLDGQATAYVCRHYVCQLPVTAPAALAGQLVR